MKILEFAKILGKLKRLKRTGWVRHKISDPESVAEHSFRTTVLTMVLAKKVGADELKSIKMALIHDIGEAEIGDVVTRIGKNPLPNLKSKIAKERKALAKILSLVDTEDYIKLFDEFEGQKTKEAKLVKQVDRLETGIQALEYETKHKIDLGEFFEYAKSLIISDYLKEILKEVEDLRRRS